jgi:hypothetical protein
MTKENMTKHLRSNEMFKNASNNGSTGGISVQLQKKVIICICKQNKLFFTEPVSKLVGQNSLIP